MPLENNQRLTFDSPGVGPTVVEETGASDACHDRKNQNSYQPLSPGHAPPAYREGPGLGLKTGFPHLKRRDSTRKGVLWSTTNEDQRQKLKQIVKLGKMPLVHL